MRLVAAEHPLAGRVVRARHVYRRYGRLWLVVVLPDGGVTSVAVEDTDVLAVEPVVAVVGGTTTLSSDGVRRLIALLGARMERVFAEARRAPGGGRVGGPRLVVDERDRPRERGATR